MRLIWADDNLLLAKSPWEMNEMWREAVRLIKLAVCSDEGDEDKCRVWTAAGPQCKEATPRGIHTTEILGTIWSRNTDAETYQARTHASNDALQGCKQLLYRWTGTVLQRLPAQQGSMPIVVLNHMAAFRVMLNVMKHMQGHWRRTTARAIHLQWRETEEGWLEYLHYRASACHEVADRRNIKSWGEQAVVQSIR